MSELLETSTSYSIYFYTTYRNIYGPHTNTIGGSSMTGDQQNVVASFEDNTEHYKNKDKSHWNTETPSPYIAWHDFPWNRTRDRLTRQSHYHWAPIYKFVQFLHSRHDLSPRSCLSVDRSNWLFYEKSVYWQENYDWVVSRIQDLWSNTDLGLVI